MKRTVLLIIFFLALPLTGFTCSEQEQETSTEPRGYSESDSEEQGKQHPGNKKPEKGL